jgi:molybdopterin molybdotransferase
VTLRRNADGLTAASTGMQSSGNICSMALADGLLIVPADSEGLSAGAAVCVQLLDGAGLEAVSAFREEAS